MFGMSFGSSAPQENKREVIAQSEEVKDVLSEFGFDAQTLSENDLEAVRVRASVIEKDISLHVNHEAAIALAYLDRRISAESEMGNTEAVNKLVSTLSSDLVSLLVDPSLSSNEEFVQTVVNRGLANYATGNYKIFSEAIMDAVEGRQHEMKTVPEITGKIDAQDNVVTPNDEKTLH